MTRKHALMSAAVSSLLAVGTLAVATAQAEDAPAKEKCYGVAKAAQNGCAGNGHSCQGQAKADNDPAEWKYVDKGQCATMGGKSEPPTKG
jgi:uncharacterized membrane protein